MKAEMSSMGINTVSSSSTNMRSHERATICAKDRSAAAKETTIYVCNQWTECCRYSSTRATR